MFFVHSWSTSCFFWISDKTLLMFDISLQSIWISNKTLPLVFDVTLRCLAIRWNTHSHLWYIISRCLDIKWITLPRVLSIQLLSDAIPGKTLFLVFDKVFLRVWISDETLSSRCLDTRRGYKITLWREKEREKMSYMKVSSILFFLTFWVCLVASLVCLLHSCFSWPPW